MKPYKRKVEIGGCTGRWVCENCGNRFDREKSGSRPIRFCTHPCYVEWRKRENITTGQFEKGLTPWNKNKKGIHLSPKSEFKKGYRSHKRLPVGSVTIRKHKRNGNRRAWVKVADPNIWKERAKVVWEKANGPIPKGHVIHHRDRNPMNDSIDNLQAMTRAEHIKEHRQELLEAKNAA